MPRATPLKLGPFIGGLNTASDPTAVADNELADCVNFELDLDGSLVQRPPFIEDRATGLNNLTAIGNALINGVKYVYFSGPGGTYQYTGSVWTTVSATVQSKVALQYRDKVYIVATAASATAGGYWDPVAATYTVQATMPRGEGAVFSKSRMFIVPGRAATVNTSRLQFCDPIVADVFVWTGTNIIDVSPGDGQNLIDVIVYNDNLLLFKRDSTYVLAYDLQITDAVLRMVNGKIGATTRYCIAAYENSIFVYHDGKVYEMNNFDFVHVNVRVPFVYDGAVPVGSTRIDEVFLNLVGDRLIIRYFNRIYVYGLKTKTWSRWLSANSTLTNFGPLVALPVTATQGITPTYYAGSCLDNGQSVIAFVDGYNTGIQEKIIAGGALVDITSSIITKNYDMEDSYNFKKLAWWGADLLTAREVTAIANPIVNTFKVRWYDLTTYRWYDLRNNYWYAPLTASVAVTTNINQASVVFRKFMKFLKALRFRQINFQIILKGDGSPASGPARLFSLTVFVGQKQLVSKQVS